MTTHSEKIEQARLKYKPEHIKCLFIAEAPPSDPDRFFYFEDVKEQDSLYLEMMKVLFKKPETKKAGPLESIFDLIDEDSTYELRSQKRDYLLKFKEKGFYLIDCLDQHMPSNLSSTNDKIKHLERYKVEVIQKVKALITTKTPIVLISVPVYHAIDGRLRQNGFRVLNRTTIEFPGSGQQKNFKDKMEEIMPLIRSL